MSSPPSPRYPFFMPRADACALSGAALQEAIDALVVDVFGDALQRAEAFGPVSRSGPDRDTQFLVIESRTVFQRFAFEGGEVSCEVGRQEAVGGDPLDGATATARELSGEARGLGWSWFGARLETLARRGEALGLRDASVSLHGNTWLDEAEAHDPEAVPALLALQREAAMAVVRGADRVLDLQRLPRQDIGALLAGVERPEAVTDMGLNHCGLDGFPEVLRGFTSLERLRLYHNPLREVPEWLGELSALRSLNVHSTPLDEAQLDALRRLLPECRIVHF